MKSRLFAAPLCWRALLSGALLLIPLAASALAADLPEVVATVNDEPISADVLTASMRGELLQMDMERYEAMKEQLDSLVAQRLFALEAAARGVSVEEFERFEVYAKMEPVSPQQVRDFYDANAERMPRPFEELEGRITVHLQRQAEIRRRAALARELRERYPVRIALAPPRADVHADDDPFMGPENAPVTLIEFSDFQCPYCRRVQSVLKRLMTAYHGQLKLVFRDFPLRQIHPEAQKAAEAAQCANDQGQFWPYHDRLFAATELGVGDLKRYAAEMGLDVESFNDCLDSEKYGPEVQRDIDDARAAGVDATPSFFVNGLPISGAVPFERFVEMVELALQSARDQ